jgi:hypothetical protein
MHAYCLFLVDVDIALTRGYTLAMFLFVIELLKPRLYSTLKNIRTVYSVSVSMSNMNFSLVLCENVITGPFYL